MSAESEIITAILAVVAADTGAGGFANTSSNAYCRTVYRNDDPDGDRTLSNWPQLYVEVPAISAMDPLGNGGHTGPGAYMCEVRWHVKTDQDTNFTQHDAIIDRIRAKFHRQELTGSTYGFSTTRVTGVQRLPPINNKELHTVVTGRVFARIN
jgi:hypothetical protein